MLLGRAVVLRASDDRADRVDAPVAGRKTGPCLDTVFVVPYPRLGKTQTLDDRRAAGRDQDVRTRDRLFMTGGGDEDANAIAARFDSRNPSRPHE